MRIRAVAAATMFGLVTTFGVVTSPAPASAAKTVKVDRVFPRGLPFAIQEDGCVAGVHRCVWDARHQGNRRGRSFILTQYRGDFLVKRITHRRAHRLQAAWCARPSVSCGYGE